MPRSRLALVHVVLLLLTLAAAGAAGAAAPPEAMPGPPETFGPAAEAAHTIQAFGFVGDTPTSTPLFSRFCFGNCSYLASVSLPAGSLVTRISFSACDSDAAGAVSATLWRVQNPEVVRTALASVDSSVPGMPGCTTLDAPLATPETIDNGANSYVVEVFLSGGSASTRFQAVRIIHRLQVSPAPPTATFGDVPPSHPFFQFVEALVASGITAGCGGGNYCPDAPLTRGQMAVFLSKALGLHFAP